MAASSIPSGRIRIGPFAFDPERRQLIGEGGSVALSSKEFGLLELLVSNRPRAISKDEIRDALWPRTVVTDASLTSLVKEVRTKLGQTGREGPIRTVHGFGYALAGEEPGAPRAAPPRLVRGTTEIAIVEPQFLLGRGSGRPGAIDDVSVSRRHALLRWDDEGAALTDLGSKNGTFVNGVRVSGSVSLRDGDEIRFGLVSFVYRAPSSEVPATETAV